jgi:hypothetical protein
MKETSRRLPTRLIDCGESSDFAKLRVVETEGERLSNVDFVTLSHCWGRCERLCLQASNYEALLQGFLLSELPRLFWDTVYVVQQLGLRYLWIDSLCIIQDGDNLTDWSREITLMSQVYLNALCNISASSACDSNHSPFHSRNPELIRPASLHYTDQYGQKWNKILHDQNVWHNEIADSHISSRAWVLQERLLSPRILHFTRTQIIWECREKHYCELYPNTWPSQHDLSDDMKNDLVRRQFDDEHSLSKRERKKRHNDCLKIWKKLVMQYTSCHLTVASDKLPTIGSIAVIMKDLLHDEYVAGMWNNMSYPWCGTRNLLGSKMMFEHIG